VTDLDLFGQPTSVRKGGTGYLEHLAELTYPDGYAFWSLALAARPRSLPAETTEMVWLVRRRHWMLAAVDITDGAILQQLERPPP
jgi:hypothetical protein